VAERPLSANSGHAGRLSLTDIHEIAIETPLVSILIIFGHSRRDPGACDEEDVTKNSTDVSREAIRRGYGARPSRRKKRMRPEPRQYTLADLERAQDRVEAAERRVDNDRTNNPNRGLAGLKRARLELHAMESQLRWRGIIE
jgi:hypothetical protein